MKVDLEKLIVLCELYKCIPPRTPNRMQVIFDFATEIFKTDFDQNDGHVPCEVILDMHDEEYYDRSQFTLTLENIIRLQQNIPKINRTISNNGRALFHGIAIPTEIICCDKPIGIKGVYATLTVYDIRDVHTVRSYHGKCKTCKCVFYHGYKQDVSGERIFNMDDVKVLIFTSGLAFTMNMLQYADSMICVGGVSFEKLAAVFNTTIKDDINVSINADRLERAWFLYRILQYTNTFASWPRKHPSKVLDVEELCKINYAQIKDVIDKKWMSHTCSEIGCRNRMIVMDGNEKLYRYICGAEKTHVKGNVGEVNRYKLCIRNPVRGNQSCKTSKFCKFHEDNLISTTEEQLDLRPRTRLYASLVPQTISSEQGCKKETSIEKYYARTAGMFYIFRPCGIRLSHSEMYTCESLSDVFVSIIDLFGAEPQSCDIRGIVYDRACDLHPFIRRLSKEGNTSAGYYEKLDFVVDGFHVQGHTQKKCDVQSPECEYHPKLTRFDKIRGMNSEIAEQSFNSLNGYKFSTRKMSYCRRLLFFKFVDDTANRNLKVK